MKHVLFICSLNQLRSPTAERVFSGRPDCDVASAGLSPGAMVPLTSDLLEWADVIFVMEKRHRRKLAEKFSRYLRDKRIVCLDIPDDYDYMDPNLVALLEKKVSPLLR